MLCVIQFSDLHVAPSGFRGYGGVGPDTGVTWEAAMAQAFDDDIPFPDRVVITGDIAEHGSVDEYRTAAARLAEIPVPTNVLTGNHDFQVPAEAYLGSTTVSMNRVERHGPWLFIYIDSNWTAPVAGVDPAPRIAANGGVSAGELDWVRAVLDVSDAEFVWLWMHHTPNASGVFANEPFTQEIAGIMRHDDRVRGVGSGHVHNNSTAEVAGRPVYVCPSMTLNVDIDTWQTLPPGYREYTFANDGSVVSSLVWVEMPEFEAFPLPEAAVSHLQGEMDWDVMVSELNALNENH